MPVFIAWFGELLLSIVGQLVLTAMVSIGIGFLATTAASGVIDHSQIAAAFASSGMVQWIGFFGIDRGITIVLSAWAGRAIVNAATLHIVKKAAS